MWILYDSAFSRRWLPIYILIWARVTLNACALCVERMVWHWWAAMVILTLIVVYIWSVSCMTTHSRSIVMSGFNWSSNATHLIIGLILRIHATSLTSKTRWSWRITNLHSWWEGVLQKYASVLSILLLVLFLTASDSWIWSRVILDWSTAINATSWWHWMMVHVAVWRINIILEVMSRNAFSLWVFLSSRSSWIEKVVDALECAASLPRDFTASLIC